jgi:hypothetical protein
MTQVSLVGYLVGGAFLNLAFWDLPYYLFAAIGTTQYVVKEKLGSLGRHVAMQVFPGKNETGIRGRRMADDRSGRSSAAVENIPLR